MRTYRGTRTPAGDVSVLVIQEGHGLAPMTYPVSFQQATILLRSWRSNCDFPDEFDWGFRGTAPLILALAIMLDATDSIILAKKSYEIFERAHVAEWGDQWEITAEEILRWIARSGALLRASPPDLRDPSYVPTFAEAVADPAGFLAGMIETRAEHFDPALKERIERVTRELQGGAS